MDWRETARTMGTVWGMLLGAAGAVVLAFWTAATVVAWGRGG